MIGADYVFESQISKLLPVSFCRERVPLLILLLTQLFSHEVRAPFQYKDVISKDNDAHDKENTLVERLYLYNWTLSLLVRVHFCLI